MSRFSEVSFAQSIELFALREAYNSDTNESKVDLGYGSYRDGNGEPYVISIVRHVEKVLAEDDTLIKEALPAFGLRSFTNAAEKLLFGIDSPALLERRTISVQVLSMTGGIYIAASFLRNVMGYESYYHGTPTAYNYCKLIFERAGFKNEHIYRYWSEEKRMLDMEGMLDDLRQATSKSVIYLYMCAHSPTGADLNKDQWREIGDVIEDRNLFVFMDCSNLGLASGSLDQDAWPVRYFVSRGFEFVAFLSFTKNLGLYNENIANLTFIVNDYNYLHKIESQLTLIIKSIYDSPSEYGARIVSYILNDRQLFNEWKEILRKTHKQIVEMRKVLRDALERLTTLGTWTHITTQVGMYAFTGLDEEVSSSLTQIYHIYLLRCGRLNMCGINHNNVHQVAEAIYKCIAKSYQPRLSFKLFEPNNSVLCYN